MYILHTFTSLSLSCLRVLSSALYSLPLLTLAELRIALDFEEWVVKPLSETKDDERSVLG